MMKRKARFLPSTTQIILLSFLLTILVGSLLLSLPLSAADGRAVPYIDALFTATTATCVTGLVTLPTATAWSTFGQVVILLLIQVGGLGVITVMAGVMLALNRRMGLGERLLIQDAFNLNTMAGLASFIRRVILGTLVIEGVGALLCMVVFLPQFGLRGIWIAVFHAVSAFCNAGMDVLASDSLCQYATHPLINLVTSLLIVLGGLGYIVWWDVLRVVREGHRQGLRCLRRLTLHSKIALSATAALLLVGGLGFLALEYHNPQTLAPLSFFDKLQVAFFQSVTTRTAGFATLPQQELTNASALLSMLLMLIGGSPVGTAGGVKTVTVMVLGATAVAMVKNRNEVTLFGRTLSGAAIRKAVAVCATSLAIVFLSALLLAAVSDASVIDVLYEAVSAAATVGLSRDLTPGLNLAGKLIVIATMYLGRVGPISFAILLNVKPRQENSVKNPTEDISVG